MNNIDLFTLFKITLDAGQEVMEVYSQDFDVEIKKDKSPLTIADRRSHEKIAEGLSEYYSDIPVLSEEGQTIAYEERKQWEKFWLVDPLDGTKEFIKRNGEFTVNIALIEGKYPTIGFIYAPELDVLYFGKQGVGAYKLEDVSNAVINDEEELLNQSTKLGIENTQDEVVRVVASRSHMSEETQDFINQIQEDNNKVDTVSSGSSLKFCLVAEGIADYYPRYAPTMEWDTGAGQAVAEAAGKQVLRFEDNERFYYNKENLKNNWFLVKP